MRNLLTVSLFVMLSLPSSGGSLNPPGPPAASMKSLDVVEARTPIHDSDLPLTILESGSYYLTENVSVETADTTGIIVSATDVTIDLNGFSLTGSGAMTGATGDGILASEPCQKLVVKNGTINKWRGHGIHVEKSQYSQLENLTLDHNGSTGIRLSTGTVRNCQVSNNGLGGIQATGGTTAAAPVVLTGNTCTYNRNSGISTLRTSGIISDNICSNNTGDGILDSVGIFAVYGSQIISRNVCERNFNGIRCRSQCIVDGNTLRSNTSYGILSEPSVSIIPGDLSLFVRNTAVGNLEENFSFWAGTRAGPIIEIGSGETIASNNPWANFSY